MAGVETLVEAASLDDKLVVDKPGVMLAKSWTIRRAGRDGRHAAPIASFLLEALRDGNGWKIVEVKASARETASLSVAPDKSPKTVKTEIAWKRLIQELRKQRPRVNSRLQHEEGVICVAC